MKESNFYKISEWFLLIFSAALIWGIEQALVVRIVAWLINLGFYVLFAHKSAISILVDFAISLIGFALLEIMFHFVTENSTIITLVHIGLSIMGGSGCIMLEKILDKM